MTNRQESRFAQPQAARRVAHRDVRHEVDGLEQHVGRAVPVRGLQLVAHLALGAALIAAGLLIMFTDRATGVVTVPADYSELGWLTFTVTGLALILPFMAIGLVKLTRLRSA